MHMVKKLFALASVTALTGLMVSVAAAGCSSTTTETTETDAAAASDTGAKKEASTPEPEDSAVSTECKGTTTVDATALPWKSPAKDIGACSADELKGLVDFLSANDTAKYAEWKTKITNPACNACVFGKESEATWKPLLENAAGDLVGLNVGGCIAIASGNDACGKSYQQWFDCRFEACADCPSGDTTSLQKCLTAASKGGCKAAFDAVGTVCGDAAIGDYETACDGVKYVFEGPIKAQCIGLSEGGE
jgi:hypothetical protein